MTTVRIRISDANIKKHLNSDVVTRLRDERYALELRFHKSRESATWWLIDKRKQNGHNGKAKWERLGVWPRLSAKALFEFLPQKIARMATQCDEVVSDWKTFADCLIWYEEHVSSSCHISTERKSTVKSVIRKHLLPAVGELPLIGVRKHQIKQDLLWPLQSQYELRTVKNYFAVLKAAFNQAVREEHIEVNPIHSMYFSDFIAKKPQPNEGKLQPDMVSSLFKQLKRLPLQKQVFVLMQLGHGTRITETRLARWSHIDWDEGVWRIPAKHTKTKESLVLPLTWQLKTLLKRYRVTLRNNQKYLFPSPKGSRPICKDTAHRIYSELSNNHWTSHHCRKLARSRLADLGVDKFVGERILNHKMSELDQAYIHTTTESLKLKALQSYHTWLDLQGFLFFHGKTEGRS
ncbi:tyrosine-type recombinase/integrase [Vibrio sp. St2]|uniref:tyrosine-type recombinase/integrase n=1 Tax=Vibrio sp. St2 TaxID=2853441 RepID=UPI00248D676D|nr:tyrosine-type recombinase/integrase [Vibrio sp. St2]